MEIIIGFIVLAVILRVLSGIFGPFLAEWRDARTMDRIRRDAAKFNAARQGRK